MDSRATPWRMGARQLVTPEPGLPRRVPSGTTAAVIGGGVAGISAAVVLAERGVRVTLLEAADTSARAKLLVGLLEMGAFGQPPESTPQRAN